MRQGLQGHQVGRGELRTVLFRPQPLVPAFGARKVLRRNVQVDLYKDYKFVLAIENKDMNGYFTEKINNPLIANSIPIYWGNKKVFDYINKKRIIYIPDYTNEELLNVIKRIDNDDIEYKNIINEPWYVNEKTPENIEIQLQKEIKEKITNILNKKILI